jgi:hypothetical protein
MGVKRVRKGVMFFTVDALIAGVILTLTVAFLLSFVLNKPATTDAKFYLNSVTDYITHTEMYQFNGSYKFVYYDSAESNPSMPIYQKILLMKSSSKYALVNVSDFVKNFSLLILPEHVGLRYELDNVLIYSRHEDRVSDAKMSLTTSLLTYALDENNVLYGPSVTKITVWV